MCGIGAQVFLAKCTMRSTDGYAGENFRGRELLAQLTAHGV